LLECGASRENRELHLLLDFETVIVVCGVNEDASGAGGRTVKQRRRNKRKKEKRMRKKEPNQEQSDPKGKDLLPKNDSNSAPVSRRHRSRKERRSQSPFCKLSAEEYGAKRDQLRERSLRKK